MHNLFKVKLFFQKSIDECYVKLAVFTTVILAESGAKTTKDLQVLEFEAQLVFPEAKIYFPKINTPFEPSQKSYSKFKKVNDAIDGLPYHHYILPALPQWVDFSKRATAYSRKNYDGIKWKSGTANIVINHWLNHLQHPDNVATCSRTSCMLYIYI